MADCLLFSLQYLHRIAEKICKLCRKLSFSSTAFFVIWMFWMNRQKIDLKFVKTNFVYINGTRRVSTMRWNSKSSFFLSNFEVLTQSFLVSGIHSYQQVVDSVKTFSTFWLEKTLRRQTAKFHLLTLFSYSLSTFCLSQKYFIKITCTLQTPFFNLREHAAKYLDNCCKVYF